MQKALAVLLLVRGRGCKSHAQGTGTGTGTEVPLATSNGCLEYPKKQISKEVTDYNQVFYPESREAKALSRDKAPLGAFRLLRLPVGPQTASITTVTANSATCCAEPATLLWSQPRGAALNTLSRNHRSRGATLKSVALRAVQTVACSLCRAQKQKKQPKAAFFVVPRAGVEPARMFSPRDFKSLVSTNFTTWPPGLVLSVPDNSGYYRDFSWQCKT